MENRLRILRAERKLTQSAAAEKAGINRTTYSMIENGKSVPDGNTVVALVRAFGVPANEIFFDFNVVHKQLGVNTSEVSNENL